MRCVARTRSCALAAMAALGVSGCLSWEELPDDAVGFLEVEEASLSGTLGGAFEGDVVRRRGVCFEDGFEVRTVARAGDRAVMSGLRFRDVAVGAGSDFSVTYAVDADGTLSAPDAPSFRSREPSLVAEGCTGPSEGEWTYEARAREVDVRMQSLGSGLSRVTYVARFDDGQELGGSFDVQMPRTGE